MMKILVIKFKNIGDVLLITPLLSNLKKAYPNAKIDVALNKGTEEMITLNPNVNDIIIYDREKIKSLHYIKRIIEEIKFGLKIRDRKYNMVINTTKGERGNFLALISKAKTKIGYRSNKFLYKKIFTHILPLHKQRHIIDIDLDSLRVLKLPIINKKVEIFWTKKDECVVNNILTCSDFIHIHPVSRWLFKCLDDATMAKIIDYCEIKLNKKVILTSAPVKQELDRINSILKLCKTKPINLSGKLTLKQTAYLNSKAKFFIGVDTAIMHISAANNIPVLAFFGPSAAFHWGPWDNTLYESGYNKTRGIQSMGKHIVIQRNWDCIPCKEDGCNGSKVSDCIVNLNMAKITAIIRKNFIC